MIFMIGAIARISSKSALFASYRFRVYMHFAGNDYNKFWNTVRRCNNNKAVSFAHVVDGCTGADAIAER